jgi:hypothetical protein
MSKKTSTAALASFRHSPLHNQRRAPRHPAGARVSGTQRSKQRNAETEHEFRQAQLVTHKEDVMNASNKQLPRRDFTTILPVVLRIAFSLLLWTLGASAMDIRISQLQPKEHRVVLDFPDDRARAEDLQRWVNAGHDSWCRDPQLVAATALRGISSQFSDYELASLPLELEHNQKTKAVYTFHSLDGRTTYRITLRRHLYLLPTAGSLHRIIWIPESAEIITRDTRD